VSDGQRYRFLFELASGGMGMVSAAELVGERGFRRTVAVKRIRRELAGNQRFVELLAQEARIASRIRHPGVVPVLELTEQDGELLLVMALVEGVSLRTFCDALDAADIPLPVSLGCRVLVKAAEALGAAHVATDDQGRGAPIVHRDVSPQNILVSFDGEVKVTDFGIAKVLREADETISSTVRGKPAYLSPEQANGEEIDARTDVWSLGVVGFELLSGQRLFKGRNDLETLRRLLEDPIPRLDQVRDNVPAPVADCIERCLQRDRAARWDTAGQFAVALRDAFPREAWAARSELAQLVDEVLPGHRDALRDDLKSALDTLSIEASDARPRPPWRGAVAAGVLGFVVAFGARAGLETVSWERPAPETARPSAPAEPPEVSEPTEAAVERSSAPATEPEPPALAEPVEDDAPPEEAVAEPATPAPTTRRRRRRARPRPASDAQDGPTAEERPDPVDRIVGEFPL